MIIYTRLFFVTSFVLERAKFSSLKITNLPVSVPSMQGGLTS